jgi:hypothetical protein
MFVQHRRGFRSLRWSIDLLNSGIGQHHQRSTTMQSRASHHLGSDARLALGGSFPRPEASRGATARERASRLSRKIRWTRKCVNALTVYQLSAAILLPQGISPPVTPVASLVTTVLLASRAANVVSRKWFLVVQKSVLTPSNHGPQHLSRLRLGQSTICRVHKQGHPSRRGKQLVQQFEPLRCNLHDHAGDAVTLPPD